MSKRPSLFAPRIAEPAPVETRQETSIVAEQNPPKRNSTRPPSREGKRVVSIYLEPEAWKQLRLLSLDLERSTQSLGEEAINLLFEKHRLNRIA
ncbi:MAG: ribbon-helix-helix domain-containing protein [Hyphomicrobiales bacterium]